MTQSYPWWRHAVIYQIYLRSFADGNGDGTGDIAGVLDRLPYLASLGVDGIWLNPWYVSPLLDGGYDVADYRAIDPTYGNLDQAKELIAEANRLGLRVLVDLVPNHTSWDHVWFKEALKAGPGSPERNRYHFVDGRGEHGEEPPNNWQSAFGGPAWTRVDDGQWYLHLFDSSQPDLNWENAEVREEFLDIIRFWLDLGAAGFRVDVAHGIAKAPGYPDSDTPLDVVLSSSDGTHPAWDRPELHEVVREWRAELDRYDDRMMVAEAWIPHWDRLSKYIRPDEYHQTFAFQFLQAPWDASTARGVIEEALDATARQGSVPTWVLSNHDVVRHVTRLGLPPSTIASEWLLDGDRSLLDLDTGTRRARALALLMLGLPGSVYMYQGEELGLPEVHDLDTSVLQDPIWKRSGHTQKGRDGCRVPIPWTVEGQSHGFGEDGSWLPQPPGWGDYSVEAQEGAESSMLELYRQAIDLRTAHLRDSEALAWLDIGDGVLAFRRGAVVCLVNYSDEPITLPKGEVLVSSQPTNEGLLLPDSSAWVSSD